MHISFWKKGLVLGIILLFVGAGVTSSTGTVVEKASSITIGNPGYIQDLIDNASDGDTINIPSGTYYENIVIDKSISLVGENKDTTVLDGGGNGTVIYISTKGVMVSGFTIQNGTNGIKLYKSNRNDICSNNILSNNDGIELSYSKSNTFSGNTISKNNCGIRFNIYSRFNTVKGNNILNSNQGILLEGGAIINNIIKNNFIDNYRDAFFQNARINRWRQNFWNESLTIPKLIHGEIYFYLGSRGLGLVIGGFPYVSLPWFPQIDWFPAKEPYDI